jgi:hypothetical protein
MRCCYDLEGICLCESFVLQIWEYLAFCFGEFCFTDFGSFCMVVSASFGTAHVCCF